MTETPGRSTLRTDEPTEVTVRALERKKAAYRRRIVQLETKIVECDAIIAKVRG